MTSRDSASRSARLDGSASVRHEERLKDIPPSRACIVSGRLDGIEYDAGRFRLVVNRSSSLPGKLASAALNVEMLRPLWGRRVTVEGMVRFRSDGRPQLIDARRIREFTEGDAVFEELPSAEIPTSRGLTPAEERQARSADFMRLWGAWPGDEPIEELLAQLRSSRRHAPDSSLNREIVDTDQ